MRTSIWWGSDSFVSTRVDDLEAVNYGCRNVFGLSSGAVIAIQAALEMPQIERLALYEPPLRFGEFDPVGWLPRYERELAAGKNAAAFATVLNGTGGLRVPVPRAALLPLIKLGIRLDGRANRPRDYVPLGDLIPTMRTDAVVVRQATGPLARFAAVRAETLLLGGDRSAAYLKTVLTGLEPVLPRVRRVTLHGVGHLAADNTGKPQLVAAQLRSFFA